MDSLFKWSFWGEFPHHWTNSTFLFLSFLSMFWSVDKAITSLQPAITQDQASCIWQRWHAKQPAIDSSFYKADFMTEDGWRFASARLVATPPASRLLGQRPWRHLPSAKAAQAKETCVYYVYCVRLGVIKFCTQIYRSGLLRPQRPCWSAKGAVETGVVLGIPQGYVLLVAWKPLLENVVRDPWFPALHNLITHKLNSFSLHYWQVSRKGRSQRISGVPALHVQFHLSKAPFAHVCAMLPLFCL